MFFLFLAAILQGPLYADTLLYSGWIDDFSTQDLHTDWNGQNQLFRHQNDELHLNGDPAGGTASIWRESQFSFGCWEFGFRQQGFAPSNQNRMYIWLVAAGNPLTGLMDGYAIRTGENGSNKRIRLFRMIQGLESGQILESSQLLESNDYLGVRICRNPSGIWELYETSDPNSEFEYTASSSETNSLVRSNYFGIQVIYTGTRRDRYHFTHIKTEKYPIFPIRFGILTNSRFEVPFSERVSSPNDVQINWDIDHSIEIDYNILNLITSVPLRGGFYEIGIQDSVFSFAVTDAADHNDIIINEFSYDPPWDVIPYVEIYNRSDKTLNLKNWRLQRRQVANEGLRIITTGNLILAPGDYLVITGDSTLLKNRFGLIPINQMDGFPPFNRSASDQIRLIDEKGSTIDSLEYIPSFWGGRGSALERKSATVSAVFEENWLTGISPGAENNAIPDTEGPVLTTFGTDHKSRLLLKFDKRILLAENDCYWCFVASSPLLSTEILTENRFLLTFQKTDSLNLKIQGVSDIFGNTIADTSITVYYLINSDHMVINEFKLSGNNRFIELYNHGTTPADISGWRVGRSVLPREQLYPDFYTQVVIHTDSYFVLYDPPAYLRNSDAVYLLSKDGLLTDSLRYHNGWSFESDDQSMERIDPLSPANDPSNWAAHPASHSAGTGNVNFQIRNDPPKVKFAILKKSQIHVYFDRFIELRPNTRFFFGNTELYPVSFNPFDASTILLGTTDNEMAIHLQIINLCDTRNVCDATVEVPVAFTANHGDLRINEIMYQPENNRYAKRPDQSEFVEILNITERYLSLEGLHLHDSPDKSGSVGSITPVNTSFKKLRPGGFAVIYADTAFSFEKSRIFNAFTLPDSSVYLRASRSTLSLTLSGRGLYLANARGEVLDSVYYRPEWHTPTVVDKRGISLEKINPIGSSALSWASSAHPEGGTPGKQNSIFYDSKIKSDGRISLNPNPFSPDGDGYHDHQFIQYDLPSSDYSIHIRIYDRFGRLMRVITENQLSGKSGYVVWDGFRNDGSLCPVGVYIIHFEAYGSRLHSKKTYRILSVLARRL